MEEDVLYFGRDFESIKNFADAVDFEDRQATQLLAFHLMHQWMNDYFNDGEDLSLVLHEDFPNVKVVLLPEFDMDEMVEKASKLLRRSSRLAKPEPPKAKPDPKTTIIRFIGTERDIDIDDLTSEVVFDCLQDREVRELIEPAMVRVDYYRTDLSEYEYNDDQRRLEIALFMRYRAEMLENRRKRLRNRSIPDSSDAQFQNVSSSAEESSMKATSHLSSSGLLQS